ncbi:hypothetical protein, partial [Pseudomonas sp. IT-196MI5]|uniref:hypothetical protein n=1 Tax=Pseudomonas sp. IT-196MI5 TaxID=3026440 RepID=UPI0039E16E6A
LAQGIGVGEQAALGVAFEKFFGLVRVDQSHPLPGAVLIGSSVPFGIGKAGELPQRIVLPLVDLSRTVDVAAQLAVSVVGQLLAAAVGVGDEDGQVVAVVAVLGGVFQQVDGFDDVAALIVIVPPQATFGVAGFDAGRGIGATKPMPLTSGC